MNIMNRARANSSLRLRQSLKSSIRVPRPRLGSTKLIGLVGVLLPLAGALNWAGAHELNVAPQQNGQPSADCGDHVHPDQVAAQLVGA